MNSTLKKTLTRRPLFNQEQPLGKLPPQAVPFEEALLAAVMLEENAMQQAAEIIKTPEAFYNVQNQFVWKALQHLYNADVKIDFMTLSDRLTHNNDLQNAGGNENLMRICNAVGSAANVRYYALMVQEKYLARRIISITGSSNSTAYADTTDAVELLDNTIMQLENLCTELAVKTPQTFAETLAAEIEQIRNNIHNPVTGVPTFSRSLDAHLLGLQPENLIVIAGRPGMGKSSVAWHLAINQAKHNIPVGFFSLEMSDRELMHKLISAEIEVNTQALRSGALTPMQWQQLDVSLQQMSTYPIYMNDTGGITLQQLLATARNWVRKHGVKVIYIDYIGKIRTTDKKFGTREQEVSYISGALKDFAKHMKIPVVVLSQLSRLVEHRTGDKRPQLSDLRDSGAIEQDADIVLFPYRPEYYDIRTDEDGPLPRGYTELILAKYRNGQPGSIRWIFEPEYSRFRDCG